MLSMTRSKRTIEFATLIDHAVPLILVHAEINFVSTVSCWMGESVRQNYARFRRSFGGDHQPPDYQVRQLFLYWKEEVGDHANIKEFIKLIDGKDLTQNIVQELRRAQENIKTGNDIQRISLLSDVDETSYKDEEDAELRNKLLKYDILFLFDPLRRAGIKAKILFDLTEQDLADLGMDKGSQIMFRNAKQQKLLEDLNEGEMAEPNSSCKRYRNDCGGEAKKRRDIADIVNPTTSEAKNEQPQLKGYYKNQYCIFHQCYGHASAFCYDRSFDTEEKMNCAKENKVCLLCLKQTFHKLEDCPNKTRRCFVCGETHHQNLHDRKDKSQAY